MDGENLFKKHQAEQTASQLGDFFPQIWKRMYDNMISLGFTESQAMDLLKTYIMSLGAATRG